MATILSITVRIDNVSGGRVRPATAATVAICRPRSQCVAPSPPFSRAERGTVHATLAYEGPEMEPVYDRVAQRLGGT